MLKLFFHLSINWTSGEVCVIWDCPTGGSLELIIHASMFQYMRKLPLNDKVFPLAWLLGFNVHRCRHIYNGIELQDMEITHTSPLHSTSCWRVHCLYPLHFLNYLKIKLKTLLITLNKVTAQKTNVQNSDMRCLIFTLGAL